jgi:hypothetical protein
MEEQTVAYETGSLGTFGFVWGNPRAVDKLLPIGKGHIPGASLIMSSTRMELCGIFAAITHLRLVVQFYHIVPPENLSCRIYCDSKGALSRVGDKFYDGFGTTWLDVPHAIRSRSCDTDLSSPAAHICLLAMGKRSCAEQQTAP